MAHDDDVIVRIKLLMCSRRYIAHRDQLGARDPRSLEFPRLADIEQREGLGRIQLSFHIFHADFVIRHGELYFPVQFGGRFSMKARIPSLASAVFIKSSK